MPFDDKISIFERLLDYFQKVDIKKVRQLEFNILDLKNTKSKTKIKRIQKSKTK